MNLDQLKSYAPMTVRYAIAFVFLWFGINQIFNPTDFMGYLPDFILQLESAQTIVIINGITETILGLLLALGIFIRPVTAILAAHLIGIIFSLGYNDIAIRDVSLLIATIAIFFQGKDKWCLNSTNSKK